MKKKSLLLMVCLLLSVLGANAKSLVIELADGTQVYYLLGGETSPTMTVTNGEVTLNDDKYSFTEVKRFFISEEDQPTGIDGLKSAEPTELKDGVLYVATSEPVSVYTTDGRLVLKGKNTDAVRSTIDTEALTAGVYVVRYGKKSFKFIKH